MKKNKIKYSILLLGLVGLIVNLSLFAKTITVDSLDGTMLSKSDFAQLIKAAKAVAPPKNGKNYVFGYANLTREITFSVKVEEGLLANAKQAGIKLLVTDNRFDGATALQNVDSFIRQKVDFVVEFQTDVNFGTMIMKRLNDNKIKVIAIDIPMKGSTFFGANNPKSGFMGGVFLAQQSLKKWGEGKVKKGYLVIGALPQSGAIPAMRTKGQIAGFLSIVKGFPEKQIIEIDSKGVTQESFAQMNNALGRIPKNVPIMGLAINDQSIIGMIRATEGRNYQDAAFVGMGADEAATLAAEDKFLASVGYFPENYGSYIIPLALMKMANKEIPPAVLVKHIMVTKGNVCEYYPEVKCKSDDGLKNYEFPQAEFENFLKKIQTDKDLQDVKELIPVK